jgi:tetratricopeptide (TPR) repeat protein
MLVFVVACGNSKEAPIPKQPVEDEYRVSFHEAMREKMRGNFDLSAELFQKCLSLNPNSDAAHFALSDLYEALGETSKIIFHAQSAFDIDNSNKWYIMRLANLYFIEGNYHKSASFFEMLIEDEKNIDVKFKFAEALIYSNNYKRAIEIMNEIEVETGKSPHLSLTKHDLYLELGDKEAAENELNTLMDESPNDVENRVIIAEYFLATNQLDKAEKTASEAIKIDPSNGSAHIVLADINLRKGDINATFSHLTDGFKRDDVSMSRKLELIWSLQPYAFDGSPEAKTIENGLSGLFELIYNETSQNDTLFTYYGIFLRNQGKTIEATNNFKKVVELNPGNYNNWIQLLNLQYEAELYEGMFEDGEKAVELFPAQPMVYLLTGIAAYETEKYESAEEWLFLGKDLVINDASLASEFLYQIGKVYCLQKDYIEGYAYFEKALIEDKLNGKVYKSKAFYLIDEGKVDAAEAEIQKALDLVPNSPFILDAMGQVYFKTERYSKAIKQYENALVYEPSNWDIIDHLGDANFKIGNVDKAVQMWEKSKQLGNNTTTIIKKIADKKYYEE